MMKLKQTSYTTRVLDLLKIDLLTQEQLRQRLPDIPPARIGVTIAYLLTRHAIAFIADEQTTLYYATSDEDDRIKTIDEHAPKVTGYKRRAKKVGA